MIQYKNNTFYQYKIFDLINFLLLKIINGFYKIQVKERLFNSVILYQTTKPGKPKLQNLLTAEVYFSIFAFSASVECILPSTSQSVILPIEGNKGNLSKDVITEEKTLKTDLKFYPLARIRP